MSILYKSGDKVKSNNNTVALGTFDGLHRAHMELINVARGEAMKTGTACGVMLFDIIPAKAFGRDVKMLMTNDEKIKLLGVDFIYNEIFNKNFYSMQPAEFVKYLKNILKADCVCVGYNYRFGKNAGGDAALLEKLCRPYGIKVIVVPEINYEGKPVSSTRIRECLKTGDVMTANALLNRPYTVSGTIVKGLQNGRKIGTPTANIHYCDAKLLPAQGVYAGYVYLDNIKYKSVINIGNNPTFNGDKVTMECHILDFDGNIYDKSAVVEFSFRIREEIKFDNIDRLKEQISRDIEVCKRGKI